MLVGPVFTRELVTAPRRARFYALRVVYVGAMLVVIFTAWQVVANTQQIRNPGDMALFGATVFQVLAPLQLAIAVFFAALAAASAVAQEKDRRTLVLLLLTKLTNSELVLGKLLAAILNVLMLLTASLPLFMFAALLGGVGFDQIARVFAVTATSTLVAGSLGSTLALWREKTFQALAMTALAIVLWLALWELVAQGALGAQWWGLSTETWAASFSPWRALMEATRPLGQAEPALGVLHSPVYAFLLTSAAAALVLNGLAIALVRVWNPSREIVPTEKPVAAETSAVAAPADPALDAAADRPLVRAKTREVWDNPIIWREVRTWAYGRRILLMRLVYLVLFGGAAAAAHVLVNGAELPTQSELATVLAPLFVLSLVLVNAQAVTALCSERDVGALDLLLVTDVTPKEFIFGKLGGVFYNTKEMVLLPLALCLYLAVQGVLSWENFTYLAGGLVVVNVFVAMLGIHAGMSYLNTRSAIGVSLGTVFFLFLGVGCCIRILLAFSGSFQLQLIPFMVLIMCGGVGLFLALGIRNPSPAIQLASFVLPMATFYALTSYLLGNTLIVFVVVAVMYGFTTAAMLIPAIFEFDVATGRTTGAD